MVARDTELRAGAAGALSGFALQCERLEAPANAREITVPSFTLTPEGAKPLFENASLRLSPGRRYGILGPNGSGKSNVIDGMLFVFGHRASKIRLKKVSELIHNSADHGSPDYAQVSVHFHDIVDAVRALSVPFFSPPPFDFAWGPIAPFLPKQKETGVPARA